MMPYAAFQSIEGAVGLCGWDFIVVSDIVGSAVAGRLLNASHARRRDVRGALVGFYTCTEYGFRMGFCTWRLAADELPNTTE